MASGRDSTPPSSVVINTQGRESWGSWFETCSGVWYPRLRPCGVAINTLVDLINWLGKPQVLELATQIASEDGRTLDSYLFELLLCCRENIPPPDYVIALMEVSFLLKIIAGNLKNTAVNLSFPGLTKGNASVLKIMTKGINRNKYMQFSSFDRERCKRRPVKAGLALCLDLLWNHAEFSNLFKRLNRNQQHWPTNAWMPWLNGCTKQQLPDQTWSTLFLHWFDHQISIFEQRSHPSLQIRAIIHIYLAYLLRRVSLFAGHIYPCDWPLGSTSQATSLGPTPLDVGSEWHTAQPWRSGLKSWQSGLKILQCTGVKQWHSEATWLANGSHTCILRKMQKDHSLMPLGIVQIQIKPVKLT